MADINDLIKVAVDGYTNRVEHYSVNQSQALLHDALVKANNGKSYLDIRDIRDGKCTGLFALVEELISHTVIEGLQQNDFFTTLVEFRNVAEGDKNLFLVENDDNLFYVAEVARGTQGIRRQRLGGVTEYTVPVTSWAIKIYEELSRVLSGRCDFNYMIGQVAKSVAQHLLEQTYALWSKATSADFGGTQYFPVAGAFDEDALLEVVAHVESAASGAPATILGTKKSLRKLKNSIDSIDQNNDIYHNGYVGTFYGTPVVAQPQRHKVGSTDFVFPDNQLTIIAGSDKPIKVVYEGNPLVIAGTPTQNADLTYEYLYIDRYGLALIMAGGNAGLGRYDMTD